MFSFRKKKKVSATELMKLVEDMKHNERKETPKETLHIGFDAFEMPINMELEKLLNNK